MRLSIIAFMGTATVSWVLVSAHAADGKSDVEVAAAILESVLETKSSDAVASDRGKCISGAQADATKFTRANGLIGFPDTSDYCLAVLIRTARDGRLLDAYEKIVADNGGDPSRVEPLPDAVGGALLKQKSTDVPIGNGLAVGIKPALAFDAGFVVAHRGGDRDMSGLPNASELKASAEDCLAQRAGDMGQCFWAGYALGARALNGHLPPIADR